MDTFTTPDEVEVTLVDAPEREPGYVRETQRVYSLSRDGTRAAVRVRRTSDSAYRYVVENLVGGKWHQLLDGDTEDRDVPFDVAVRRAAAVLFAPKKG